MNRFFFVKTCFDHVVLKPRVKSKPFWKELLAYLNVNCMECVFLNLFVSTYSLCVRVRILFRHFRASLFGSEVCLKFRCVSVRQSGTQTGAHSSRVISARARSSVQTQRHSLPGRFNHNVNRGRIKFWGRTCTKHLKIQLWRAFKGINMAALINE